STSSGPNRAPSPWSVANRCTSSCTTGGTCSASPATDGATAMRARRLLIRGMLVGAAAGLLTFGFGWLFGEGPIDAAIAYESAHAVPGVQEPEAVSRVVQSTLGLGVAVVVYGAALGGIFALLFAFVHGRVTRAGARATSAVLAGVGFVAVYLVPFLKYPAN